MHKKLIIYLTFLLTSCYTENIEDNSKGLHQTDTLLVVDNSDTVLVETVEQKIDSSCGCSLSVSIKYSERGRPYFESPNSNPVGWWNNFDYEPCDLGLTAVESLDGYFKIKIDDLVNDHSNDSLKLAGHKELMNLQGKWMKGEDLFAHFDDGFHGDGTDDKDYNKDYQILEFPSLDSAEIRTLDRRKFDYSGNEIVKIIGCCREWFFAEVSFNDGPVQGWIPWYHFCSNNCTNCHTMPEEGFPIYNF